MNPLKIVIVGGVAGGASAATRARRTNEFADITLIEKDPDVSFANCGMPYFIGNEIKERAHLLVATPELLMNRYRIDVKVCHQVTKIDRQNKQVEVCDLNHQRTFLMPYDRLILSPGAEPVTPALSGLDSQNVFTLRTLQDADKIKHRLLTCKLKHVAIVGAGFIGLEMAEQLVHLGFFVRVIELAPQILSPFDKEMAFYVQKKLQEKGVEVHLKTSLKSLQVKDQSVVSLVLQDNQEIPVDLLILGLGVKPQSQLARECGLELNTQGAIVTNAHNQTSDPSIYAVGDAALVQHAVTLQPMLVPLAGPANRAGRLAGEHAAMGHSKPNAPVLGTSIVRIFDMVAALTGINEKTAKKLGINYQVACVQANHHASYFPGAQPILIKVLWDTLTHRILGAQAIGAEGVDKRIDVIATAIQLGATVDQLAMLDLCYAPPFGSAKDPVHMLGFIASNVIAGLLQLTTDVDALVHQQVVDVRSTKEVEQRPVPLAIHIPLELLRERLATLNSSVETVIFCHSGMRAYLASQILRQRGFTFVKIFSGGEVFYNLRQQAAQI